jgi:hypothetical protein
MQIDLGMVQGGMDVFGSDGEKVGTVASIARDRDVVNEHVQDGDRVVAPGERYLEVDHWETELWIPESIIAEIAFANGVVLSCTKGEAEARFAGKPNVL